MALEWESEAHEKKDTIGVKYAIATRQSLLSMLERVQLQPTIDAQPVKYGKWKRNASGELECSNCMYVPKWDDDKFCANCGAKMDGESDACNDLYDKMQDEIKELRRLLRLAVDDLGKFAAIDECVFPFCDERCPFYTYTDCSENKQWQHHDEAWCILNDGSDNDA